MVKRKCKKVNLENGFEVFIRACLCIHSELQWERVPEFGCIERKRSFAIVLEIDRRLMQVELMTRPEHATR